MQITPIGDLLAMSYVKEVRSSENPVCYKRAYVVKVIDERFRFEEVNIPLGVMKASSLQVSLTKFVKLNLSLHTYMYPHNNTYYGLFSLVVV